MQDHTKPRLVQGEVVIATIRSHNLYGTDDPGKPRPVVLLRPAGRSGWLIMGLTTLPAYADGTPRIPIADPYGAGLNGPGYLWGNPCTLPTDNITSHLGWCHERLIADIAALADLDEGTVARMTVATTAERAREEATA